MDPLIIVALTFVGVIVLVVGSYWLLVSRPEQAGQRALERRMRPPESAKAKRLAVPTSELRARHSPAALKKLQKVVDNSGLKLTVPAMLFACWLSGFLAGVVVWMVQPIWMLAAGVGLVFSVVPYLVGEA